MALGRINLPATPAPGFGGLLLGGIVAGHIEELDPDLFDDLHRLTLQLQEGMRVPQPRLRHRFQQDRIGLTRSVHRLVGHGEDLTFEFEEKGAAGPAHPRGGLRRRAAAARRPTPGDGHDPQGHALVGCRSTTCSSPTCPASTGAATGPPPRSAIRCSGPSACSGWPTRRRRGGPAPHDVQRQFRDLLRDAHPDHGGDIDDAAQRIADLTEARRILLAS